MLRYSIRYFLVRFKIYSFVIIYLYRVCPENQNRTKFSSLRRSEGKEPSYESRVEGGSKLSSVPITFKPFRIVGWFLICWLPRVFWVHWLRCYEYLKLYTLTIAIWLLNTNICTQKVFAYFALCTKMRTCTRYIE